MHIPYLWILRDMSLWLVLRDLILGISINCCNLTSDEVNEVWSHLTLTVWQLESKRDVYFHIWYFCQFNSPRFLSHGKLCVFKILVLCLYYWLVSVHMTDRQADVDCYDTVAIFVVVMVITTTKHHSNEGLSIPRKSTDANTISYTIVTFS